MGSSLTSSSVRAYIVAMLDELADMAEGADRTTLGVVADRLRSIAREPALSFPVTCNEETLLVCELSRLRLIRCNRSSEDLALSPTYRVESLDGCDGDLFKTEIADQKAALEAFLRARGALTARH